MLGFSKQSRFLINVFGVPIILYGIYSEYAFPFMVFFILIFSSIEYSDLTTLLGAKINKYIFLIINSLLSIDKYISLESSLFYFRFLYTNICDCTIHFNRYTSTGISLFSFYYFCFFWCSTIVNRSYRGIFVPDVF